MQSGNDVGLFYSYRAHTVCNPSTLITVIEYKTTQTILTYTRTKICHISVWKKQKAIATAGLFLLVINDTVNENNGTSGSVSP